MLDILIALGSIILVLSPVITLLVLVTIRML